jgi:hypothetical protein
VGNCRRKIHLGEGERILDRQLDAFLGVTLEWQEWVESGH